jgi:hypothetical protein
MCDHTMEIISIISNVNYDIVLGKLLFLPK